MDWTLQKGPFEFLGEAGWVDIGIPGAIKNSTRTSGGDLQFLTDDMFGYYAQDNYHFMFDWLRDSAPVLFREESTFTTVVRWGDIDLGGPNGDRTRLTLGLNFRPIERTVFKFDYQFNDGDRPGDRTDAFLFSFATYF